MGSTLINDRAVAHNHYSRCPDEGGYFTNPKYLKFKCAGVNRRWERKGS
jgi:hypothetical protein